MGTSYYSHILWDWNGTLLDDRDLALSIVNDMLGKRGLAPISMATYLTLFDHPVMDFYRAIGLGPEVTPVAQVAAEFQSGYTAGYRNCQLQPGAEQMLWGLRKLGVKQSVLSASQRHTLRRLVTHFGAAAHFQSLLGLDDHLAHSKIELAETWLAKQPFLPERVLLIGDTTHDFDTAKAIGCDCLLVARGHQSRGKLAECGVPVIDDLRKLADSCGLFISERLFGWAD